ncbi:Shr3 amino acid permease chaperone [Ascobolus immersus RN42]|uniref:Shr3 amino acid permease chaperone n=1 Tax=Ascobolus immersus RN42 TaxID=1160509 RepID=A0A3N4IVI9_ASCIM|nr:Shr3 amino acid permease chaperone [Ascobolus immersus RN42]
MARMPFATFLIICPTSFFLGILFTNWAYDNHTLWQRSEPSEATLQAIESHYNMLYLSPPIISRLLNTIIATGLLAFISKLYKPSESNLLFDGASLVLYFVGLVMYLTNIVQGLEIVHVGKYGKEVGRVDSLRVIAASQTILALVLVGVLALQAGQWYAEAKEREEMKAIEEKERRMAEEQKVVKAE